MRDKSQVAIPINLGILLPQNDPVLKLIEICEELDYRLGYGNILARLLDNQMCSNPENGLLKALYSSHPSSDDRIAKLQDLGATYGRY